MAQRVKEYVKVKTGKDDDKKVNLIIEKAQFKEIVSENLYEFKTWYTKQMEKRVTAFADQAMEEFYNNALNPTGKTGSDDDYNIFDYNMPSANTQQDVIQTAYRKVDQLNEIIFNSSMKQIKQMMTISIMETQVLLDKINL